jgi:hypothetical protein
MLANYYLPQVSSFSLASARQGFMTVKVEGWFTQAKTMLYLSDPNCRHVQVLSCSLSSYRFRNKSSGEKDKNIFSRHDGVCLEFNIKKLNDVHYFMSTPCTLKKPLKVESNGDHIIKVLSISDNMNPHPKKSPKCLGTLKNY